MTANIHPPDSMTAASLETTLYHPRTDISEPAQENNIQLRNALPIYFTIVTLPFPAFVHQGPFDLIREGEKGLRPPQQLREVHGRTGQPLELRENMEVLKRTV